jgi:hypothetical protein
MPTPKQHLGVKGDECNCGRRLTIRHCPACGSSRHYARRNRFHKHLDGSYKEVPVEFSCYACGHLYIDEEREFCSAPPVGQKLAQQRVRALYEAGQAGEYLRPEDQKIADAIRELLPNPKTGEERPLKERINNFDIIRTQLMGIYADQNAELARQHKPKQTESMESFVERKLKEASIVDPRLELDKGPTTIKERT